MPANAIASVGCSNGFVGGMAPLSSRLLNMKLGAAGRQPDCNRESGRAIGARIIALDRYPRTPIPLGDRLFYVTTVSIVCTIKAPVPVRAEDGLDPPYLHGR